MGEETAWPITVSDLIEHYEKERPHDGRMILTLKLVERIQSLSREEKVLIIRALMLLCNTDMSIEQAMRRVGL